MKPGIENLAGSLRKLLEDASGRARKVNGAVHAHPWQTLATTALVAFIAGLLVPRR